MGAQEPAAVEAAAQWLRKHFDADAARGFSAVFVLDLKGPSGGSLTLRLEEGVLAIAPGAAARRDVAIQVEASDFLSGDFYGDISDQRTVGKLFGACTPGQPAEIMTTRCTPGPAEHVNTKDEDLLTRMAAAVVSCGAAASIIDGVNPDGTIETAVYKMIGRVYEPIAAIEAHLGGEGVADVGLYFSDTSKMSFAEDGKPAAELRIGDRSYPHLRALRGAGEKLQRGQVPFAVVTRRHLADRGCCSPRRGGRQVRI